MLAFLVAGEREFKEGIQCWVSLGCGVWTWAELAYAFLVTDSVTQAAQELPQRQQRFSDFTVRLYPISDLGKEWNMALCDVIKGTALYLSHNSRVVSTHYVAKTRRRRRNFTLDLTNCVTVLAIISAHIS